MRNATPWPPAGFFPFPYFISLLRRFGAPFSEKVPKELNYTSLQEEILKAMPNVECCQVGQYILLAAVRILKNS